MGIGGSKKKTSSTAGPTSVQRVYKERTKSDPTGNRAERRAAEKESKKKG